MQAATGYEAAEADLRAVVARFHTASDDELIADVVAVEALGRLVDAHRLAAAAEVERRSHGRFGEQRLSFVRGARDGVHLLQQVARIGHREAKRRVGLGASLAPAVSLLGDLLPGRHPQVAEAVESGAIGLDSARVIVGTVKQIRARVAASDLDAMVESLVQCAVGTETETVQEAADAWALALDPDGPEPKEREQRRERAFAFGQTLASGITKATIWMTAEDAAMLRAVFHSRRHRDSLLRTEAGSDDDVESDGPEWQEEVAPDGGPGRTRKQQDYDTLVEVVTAGVEAEAVEGAVIQETVITITADELERREGAAWAPGVMAGLPVPVVERRACTGGVRLMVTGPKGEPLHLSRSQRLFTAAQRKALVAAAGGRCQVPGCRVPAPYLEAHHVRWYGRDEGPTDIDNGIMLCGHHHHLVHAQHPPIRIVRHEGAFFIVPLDWVGPPDPRHRARIGFARR